MHLSWPCELGADQVRVHGLADSVRDVVLLVVLVAVVENPAIVQLLFQQSMSFVFCASSQFLDRVLGHSSWLPCWRCTVHTVHRTVWVPQVQFLVWC